MSWTDEEARVRNEGQPQPQAQQRGQDGAAPARRRKNITVGVLALQGAFSEHVQLLRRAFQALDAEDAATASSPGGGEAGHWHCEEVRTPDELARCDALIVPGGESTTIALVASRSGLMEPLRRFVRTERRPVWGTCAGMILLSDAATRTKRGGQDLVGGLDVLVNRNHFGRQVESFEGDVALPCLDEDVGGLQGNKGKPFRGVFIRAPVVETRLPDKDALLRQEGGGEQPPEGEKEAGIVLAPPRGTYEDASEPRPAVEVLATIPRRSSRDALLSPESSRLGRSEKVDESRDIVAVRQGNVLATSFHPELTDDARIHVWWLRQVRRALEAQ